MHLTDRWWWFNPAQVEQKCEAALAWENNRRTRSYAALWRKWKRNSPLVKPAEEPCLASAFQTMHFIRRAREALGQPYFDFLIQDYDPALGWPELAEQQRLKAQGFIISGGEALQVNPEFKLPRQEAEGRPRIGTGVVELDRDSTDQLCPLVQNAFAFALNRVAHQDFFRELYLPTPGPFVFIFFDTRAARDALLASLDER